MFTSLRVKVKELTLSYRAIYNLPTSPTSNLFPDLYNCISYYSLTLFQPTCCLDMSSTLRTQGLCYILFLENAFPRISAWLYLSSFKFLVQVSLYLTSLSQLSYTKYLHSATSSLSPPIPLILLKFSP